MKKKSIILSDFDSECKKKTSAKKATRDFNEKFFVKKFGGAWQCIVCEKIFSSRYKAVNHLEEHNL